MANTLVTANAQDGGVSNLATGSFTGDGNITDAFTGFRPRLVKLINLTDDITYEWVRGMAATQTLKTIANGTLSTDTTSAIVSKGNTDSFRGFEVTAAVAITGKVFSWYAFG